MFGNKMKIFLITLCFMLSVSAVGAASDVGNVVSFDDDVETGDLDVDPPSGIDDINNVTYSKSEDTREPVIYGEDLSMYYKNGSRYEVSIYQDGKIINSQNNDSKVIFNVNGVNYLKTTDSQGNAKLNINLRPGNYLIKASYNGNLYNVPEITNTIVVLPTIESKNIVKKYKNNTQFYAYILNNNGLNLANTPYTFNINGIIHSGTSNNEGVIKININLSPGNYIATVTNPLDNLDIGYTIQVIKDDVQLIAENYVNNKKGEYYQAKLLDSSNKPIIGQNIKIIANGVTYVKTTDSKGIAKLKINYDPGIKQIYCEFIGDNYYNPYITPNKTITILNSNTKLNVSIIHENKLFNTTQCIFSIKLQDNNGYDMANKNLLFNINNLTYNLLTNNDGIAQICLNLTEGNYLTMTLFNTSNYYNIAQIFTYITVNLTNNFNNSTIVYENIEYNENKTDMIEYELRIFNDENDIEEIMGLITRTIISGQSSSGWNETYPTKEIFVKDIDNQYLYLYEDNHIVIGIISLVPGPDPDYQSIIWKNSGTSPLVLHRLCVDPHRQREGIGSRLMNFAETFGHEQGYTSLQLDTRISNHTAANLYEQLGYTKTGTITRNRGNFICYEKKL